MEGARFVRSPQDALNLLYGAVTQEVPDPPVELEPQIRRVLEEVGAGADTLAKLTAHGAKSANVAFALTELELQGLLLRGDGGRYLPSAGVPAGEAHV
jgi:predicted Rossmann fold nucleotide-binding protein DprA/Smf involved in DNA uptake